MSELINIIIIFILLLLVIFITFYKYDSNRKIKYTIENHYKIHDIIKKNIENCDSGKKNNLEEIFVVNLDDFCNINYTNKDILKLISVFNNLFENINICNLYKSNVKNKCISAVINKDIKNISNGETIISLVDNRFQIKTQISSSKNITNIINLK